MVEGVKSLEIFPERCPALRFVQQDGEDTGLINLPLGLHSKVPIAEHWPAEAWSPL